jgi:hypothetical protein
MKQSAFKALWRKLMTTQGPGLDEHTPEPLPQGSPAKLAAPPTRSAASAPRPFSLNELVRGVLKSQESQISRGAKPVTDEVEAESYRKAFDANEEQRHRHREMVTPALRNITQGWIIAVVMFLFWQGFGYRIGFFHLSDNVLITLLTTTTVNVLGLFCLALKYL